jgi:alkylation response protein AidB-like acyl-CoA dehydrogenase
MGHYKSNVRDIEFNLFEVLGTDALLGTPPFTDIDEDTARGIIAEVARLAEGPVGESFADGDRNPPVFDPETHSVTLPESIKRSFQALQQAEFWRLETSPELGGQVAPRTVVWAVAEQILGANPALHIYLAGPPFASILYALGNEKQRMMAQRAIDRGWG